MNDSRSGTETVFEGRRPAKSGDLALETHGMAPIPVDARYGSAPRNFFIWFASNMNVSTFFTGTLAVVLGLSFWYALIAITLGIVIGAAPVAWLALMGPRTGMGILPLSRLPFGKSVPLPAVVQWLTTVAWDALIGIFGGAALQSLLHVPFALGVLIVFVVQGAVGFLGYEFIHRFEKWASVITAIFFAILVYHIIRRHDLQMNGDLHGGAAVGTFILMVTISISLAISWSGCASDYSRYMPPDSSRPRVFWFTFAGLVASFEWTVVAGLMAGKFLSNQTAEGIRTLVGGGAVGAFALVAIAISAVASNAIEDYSGSLALQAGGVRVRRPIAALASTAIAFAIILWIHSGQFATRFENVLLFTGYWIAPFFAIILANWFLSRNQVNSRLFQQLMDLKSLRSGWPALAAFVIGFVAMLPFMNTALVFGAAAKALDGADISYLVGFLVAFAVYFALARHSPQSAQPAPGVYGQDSATPRVR
jgi:nucleobase:cation symporter-1, NCS1 family